MGLSGFGESLNRLSSGALIRFFDILFSSLGIFFLSPVFLLLIIFGWLDTRSPIFSQTRLGKNKRPFKLLKFRSMALNTQSVATHMVSHNSITKYGKFLRRTKLDELPQLLNVLIGEMSLVGARPCLPNQPDLISLREQNLIFNNRPGITGLPQINGVDMSDPAKLVSYEAKMMETMSVWNYFYYIIQTVCGKGSGDRVISN